uniref:Uncharacterized protein n=1 Tax=Anguilla anguilla TaxID=7936 RepID=A0A0E9XY64_ANGAN
MGFQWDNIMVKKIFLGICGISNLNIDSTILCCLQLEWCQWGQGFISFA